MSPQTRDTSSEAGEPASPNVQPAQGPRPSRSKGSNFTRAVILFVLVLVAVGGAYLFGRYEVTERAETAEQEVASLQQELQAQRNAQQAQTSQARTQAAQLEARRQLSLALDALDARNFGIAQQRLQLAGDLLENNVGDAPELAELAGDLKQVRIAVADDVGQQRSRIRAFIQRFDDAVPPAQL